MSKPKKISEVAKVYTHKSGTEANLFIYGLIGDRYDSGDDDAITALNIRKTIDELVADGIKVVNVRINSYGGYTSEGLAIITALKECPVELHTWNDGYAYSMAADIWFAAPIGRRHMAKGSTLMIHAPSSGISFYGTAQKLREVMATAAEEIENTAQMLDSIAEGTISVMAEGTDMTADEIRKQFYDYADHTLTFKDCVKAGFVNDSEPYTTETPSAVKGFMNKILKLISPNFPASDTTEEDNQDNDMISKDSLLEALKKGDITPEDVQTVLDAQKAAKPLNESDVEERIATAIKKLKEEDIDKRDELITKLSEKLDKALSKSGGVAPTTSTEGADAEGENDPPATKMSAEDKAMQERNSKLIADKKAGRV